MLQAFRVLAWLRLPSNHYTPCMTIFTCWHKTPLTPSPWCVIGKKIHFIRVLGHPGRGHELIRNKTLSYFCSALFPTCSLDKKQALWNTSTLVHHPLHFATLSTFHQTDSNSDNSNSTSSIDITAHTSNDIEEPFIGTSCLLSPLLWSVRRTYTQKLAYKYILTADDLLYLSKMPTRWVVAASTMTVRKEHGYQPPL